LYAVFHCITPRPELHWVQNPFAVLIVGNKGSVIIGAARIVEASRV
jgi:hypothetical protein